MLITSSPPEVAYAVCKNKNRKSDPYVKKPFLKLDNQDYRLDYLRLRIPAKPREFIYITFFGRPLPLPPLLPR